jgi:UDP-GlcNAc3NAcA epimerase
MKLLTVIGARPQFVKAAVVSRAISTTEIEEVIVHTGQHYDDNMSQVFFDDLRIPRPKYNLEVAGGRHGASTGEMMEKIEKVLIGEAPDAVMVYGDTNTTLAGALATKKLNIPLIHIEAGLRSFEMGMPEEINRVITDRISDVLFCPTQAAVSNLKKEGFDSYDCLIVQSGDVMKDAALFYNEISDKNSDIIRTMGLGKYVVSTIHRPENTDQINNLQSIVNALNTINKQIQVVMPLHPRTKNMMRDNRITCDFTVIEPVGYLDMIQLIKNSELVITDSGGLQKEAFFFEKHCITLREQTEWVELVDHGLNIVTGSSSRAIVTAYHEMKTKQSDFSIELYGNGNAAQTIVNSILKFFT